MQRRFKPFAAGRPLRHFFVRSAAGAASLLAFTAAYALSLTPAALHAAAAPSAGEGTAPRRNAVIIVCDGLRAGSVTASSAPAIYRLEMRGVRFENSHSLFPTVTTPNASAIASGHFLGDTSDFSNTLFLGYPVFDTGNFGNAPGTAAPFLESDSILADVDDHFGGNYLTEETLLAYAREHGYDTVAVGKQGPTLIQDVTQGNIDHAAAGGKSEVDAPQTIIIDDSTGKPGGMPLSAAAIDALTGAGLPQIAPSRSNGAAATSRASNGWSGTLALPGTSAANVTQQQYFADAVTKAILPGFKASGKPFALVFWSRDPDGTQHNQGDSLNQLAPGINGPTSLAAVKNADHDAAQILDALDALGLAENTDVFVVADHGFSTISKHELGPAGAAATRSYAAGFTYKNTAGAQDVNAGFLPPGFVAIDLAHALALPLFDPDTQVQASGGKMAYKPVDASLGQHPAGGNGLIGGSGAVTPAPDAQVVVAGDGGSDLIYVPNRDPGLVRRIVAFLSAQDYVSGLFVDDRYGDVPGALPLSAVNLKGEAKLPTPAIFVNFRSFADDPARPYQSGVEIADTVLQEGQGMHGSFSRADTFNFMAACGPDFKKGTVDVAPVSNADVAPTLAAALGFKIPSRGSLVGRVIAEALAGAPDVARGTIGRGVMRSKPAASGERTVLEYQQVGQTRYFDAAGFAGRTDGLR